jgi:hypothetical protein
MRAWGGCCGLGERVAKENSSEQKGARDTQRQLLNLMKIKCKFNEKQLLHSLHSLESNAITELSFFFSLKFDIDLGVSA